MEVRLHTFLIADISGYSSFSELSGDEAAAELALGFANAASRIAHEYGGEVVKAMGDAVLVHCPNAGDAIALGSRLTEALRSGWSGPGPSLIHAGVHTGPALKRAGDWWGSTVNITSRVAAAAKAGQLLVTEAARAAAGDAHQSDLTDIGVLRLKNISAPIRVYSRALATDPPEPVWPPDEDTTAANLVRQVGPESWRDIAGDHAREDDQVPVASVG